MVYSMLTTRTATESFKGGREEQKKLFRVNKLLNNIFVCGDITEVNTIENQITLEV